MVTAARAGEGRTGATRRLADDPFHCVTFWHLHTCSTVISTATYTVTHSDTISLSTIIQPQTVGWNIYSDAVSWYMYTLPAGTYAYCQLEHVHTVSWNICILSAGTCTHCQLEHVHTVSWNT